MNKVIMILAVCLLLTGCTNKGKDEKNNGQNNTLTSQDNGNLIIETPLNTDTSSQLPDPPPLSIKANKLPIGSEVVVIELEDLGNIEIQLFPEETPLTVTNFEKMVGYGLYDGLSFNRAYVYAFIAAGNPDEKGVLIYDRLEPEEHKHPCKRGSICMTRLIIEETGESINDPQKKDTKDGKENAVKSDKKETATKNKPTKVNYGEVSPSEFFIVLDDANGKFWNQDFTVFGSVITGIENADKISEIIDWKNRVRKNSKDKSKQTELKTSVLIKRITIQWVGGEKPPIVGNPQTIPNYGALPAI